MVVGTTAWPLTFDPLIVTLHTTFVSVFWPVLAKLSVNVGAGLAGIAFVAPVVSWLPPTLTVFSSCPCRPGAIGCEVAQIVKSLVFRAIERDEPILVLASGAIRVDETKLAATVKAAAHRTKAV